MEERRLMKWIIAAAVAAFVSGFVSAETGRRAEAYPGGYCTDSSGCSKCEVCVKEKAYESAGKCMPIAGCY